MTAFSELDLNGFTGSQEMRLTKKTILFSLVFVLAFGFIWGNIANSRDKIELTQDQINLLSKLQNLQLISIEPKLNRAYIDSGLWGSMEYKLKEDFAAALAIYCGNEKGTYLYWVEIYDKYSGKKLAKYSRNWGFKVY